MNLQTPRTIAVVLAFSIGTACTSQSSSPEQRLAEIEKQLAETQKQLDDAKARATPAEQIAAAPDRAKPREFTLPSGTAVAVRTTAELSTAKVSDGSVFDALLERDLMSGDTVVAASGTRVMGFVVSSDQGGRVKGVASLTVGVRSIVGVRGNVIAVTTDSYSTDAASTRKKIRYGPASRPV